MSEIPDSIQFDQILDLDRLIHERVRLGIMAALSTSNELSFPEIKRLLSVTDGNLSVHLRLLEKNGYIAVEKTFVGRKPQTTYRLTEAGKKAFKDYITRLEKLVRDINFE